MAIAEIDTQEPAGSPFCDVIPPVALACAEPPMELIPELQKLGGAPGWGKVLGEPALVARRAQARRTPAPRYSRDEYPERTSYGRWGTQGGCVWKCLEPRTSYRTGRRPRTIFGFIVPLLVTTFHVASPGPAVSPIGVGMASRAVSPVGSANLVAPLAGQPRGYIRPRPCEGSLRHLAVSQLAGAPQESTLIEPEEEPESLAHLVQRVEEVDRILQEEMPPAEYYDGLGPLLQRKFPGSKPDLVEHVVALAEAWDVSICFGLSFGIAKFDLAQAEVSLVGELVGREGRKPDPRKIRAVKAFPEVTSLKQLQEFLGVAGYVRPHAGPAYSRIFSPLRRYLKPGAVSLWMRRRTEPCRG